MKLCVLLDTQKYTNQYCAYLPNIQNGLKVKHFGKFENNMKKKQGWIHLVQPVYTKILRNCKFNASCRQLPNVYSCHWKDSQIACTIYWLALAIEQTRFGMQCWPQRSGQYTRMLHIVAFSHNYVCTFKRCAQPYSTRNIWKCHQFLRSSTRILKLLRCDTQGFEQMFGCFEK
jgi:hypothetical protein